MILELALIFVLGVMVGGGTVAFAHWIKTRGGGW